MLLTGTSFVFAVMQSICTFFVALGGLRLLLGSSALVVLEQGGQAWDKVHGDAIRIPMMVASLVAVLLSLYSLFRVRKLRRNSASQWRQHPVPKRVLRWEALQICLQALVIALLVSEEVMHIKAFHHL